MGLAISLCQSSLTKFRKHHGFPSVNPTSKDTRPVRPSSIHHEVPSGCLQFRVLRRDWFIVQGYLFKNRVFFNLASLVSIRSRSKIPQGKGVAHMIAVVFVLSFHGPERCSRKTCCFRDQKPQVDLLCLQIWSSYRKHPSIQISFFAILRNRFLSSLRRAGVRFPFLMLLSSSSSGVLGLHYQSTL